MTRTKAEGTDSLSNDPLKQRQKKISKELCIINFGRKSFKADSFEDRTLRPRYNIFFVDEMLCSFPSLTKYAFSGIQRLRSCFNTISREIGNT